MGIFSKNGAYSSFQASSIEVKQAWVKRLREMIQETYFNTALPNLSSVPSGAGTGATTTTAGSTSSRGGHPAGGGGGGGGAGSTASGHSRGAGSKSRFSRSVPTPTGPLSHTYKWKEFLFGEEQRGKEGWPKEL